MIWHSRESRIQRGFNGCRESGNIWFKKLEHLVTINILNEVILLAAIRHSSGGWNP
jgi:hypothetical protein